MTRDEVLAAVAQELGRELSDAEIAYLDRIYLLKEGDNFAVPIDVVARQIEMGIVSPDAADPGAAEDEEDDGLLGPVADDGRRDLSAIPEDLRPFLEFPRDPSVRTGPTARIPADLERRFRQAATNAGMQPAQIDAELVSMAPMFADPAMQSQAETLLEGRIADLEQQVPAGPAPVGVPRDFVAQRNVGGFAGSPTQGPTPDSTLDIDPRYFDGDEWSPAGQSPEEIARIQSRLEAAGLLNPDSYWAGTWDDQTVAAYRSALGMANASGRSVDAQIARLVATLPESVKEQRRRAEAAETFQAPPYMRPDPDTLAQDVKDIFRSRLGREPTPEDLAWGIQGLGADFRAQYEAQVAAARAEFDAGQALEPGVGGGAFQSVDPVSSFRERLEQRFGPEIDRLAALPEVRDNMNNVYASLRTMGSLIG